jgi:hypothetical protein
MIGSLFKYAGDRGGPNTPHGGNLYWPGTPLGFPLRGVAQPPLMRKEEIARQTKHVLDFHCQIFDLTKPEDQKAYQEVRDRAGNGWYHVTDKQIKWKEDATAPTIYLEWVQIYGELPTDKAPWLTNSPGQSPQRPTFDSVLDPVAQT